MAWTYSQSLGELKYACFCYNIGEYGTKVSNFFYSQKAP
jgi:hypothetical protein